MLDFYIMQMLDAILRPAFQMLFTNWTGKIASRYRQISVCNVSSKALDARRLLVQSPIHQGYFRHLARRYFCTVESQQ